MISIALVSLLLSQRVFVQCVEGDASTNNAVVSQIAHSNSKMHHDKQNHNIKKHVHVKKEIDSSKSLSGNWLEPWKKSANFSPPHFRGLHCYNGSLLNDCPLPKICYDGSTCVLYQTGYFIEKPVTSMGMRLSEKHTSAKHNKDNHLSKMQAHRLRMMCPRYHGGEFIRGKWKKSCYYPWLTGKDMLGVLAGKHIAFVGDSLIRQVISSRICTLFINYCYFLLIDIDKNKSLSIRFLID